MVALDPPVILIAPELEQVERLGPATAVGAFTIVKVFVEVALPQGALPAAVNVNITLPAVISAALGVYVGVNVVPFVNVPLPLVLQLTPL